MKRKLELYQYEEAELLKLLGIKGQVYELRIMSYPRGLKIFVEI